MSEIDVDGTAVRLTHPDRQMLPGLTKRDLAAFAERIAPYVLPHLRGRALTLQRFPDGIDGDGFYQKRRPQGLPDHVGRVVVSSSEGPLDEVCVDTAADLVALVQVGAITLHRALARGDSDTPDLCVFDLDPPDDDRFDLVRWGARTIRQALVDRTGDEPWVMTTGSRGLHVVIGLDATEPFDAVRSAARAFAKRLAAAHPDRLTVAQRKDKRGGRLYLDVQRNAYGQTAVAPYAIRARRSAPLAAPVRWDEVDASLDPRGITVHNVFRRLGQMRDPWAGEVPLFPLDALS